MYQNDMIGVILVYLYVAVLLVVTEKLMKKDSVFGRKFLHIMVGNIAFLLPIFVTKEIMAFCAAAPFISLTFLMSPHTPIKSLRGKTSAAGHGMGLVYYVISWTILAYVFFDDMVIIAIGIFAMSYGDGFASLLGQKFGNTKFKIYDNSKSYFGSTSMLIMTVLMGIIALIYYEINITFDIVFLLIIIGVSATVAELITPKGLDNLSVPLLASFYFYLAMIL